MTTRNTIIALALTGMTACADAATVIFSGANYADGLISTSGSLIGALNFGDTALTSNPTTINGVDFAEYGPNFGAVALVGLVTFNHTGGNASGANGIGDAATTITNTGIFNSPGNAGTGGHLQLGGLTLGQQYQVQMVFSDTRAFLSTNLISIWDQSSATGGADFITSDIKTAQIITGTFTADSTTQDFYLRENTNFGDFDGYIGAFQLRAVPEPSSLALLGASGLLVLRRRRK